MDPNAALVNAREAVGEMKTLLDIEEWDGTAEGDEQVQNLVTQIVESFTALDEWLRSGGFAPRDWLRGHPTSLYEKCAECHLFVEPNNAFDGQWPEDMGGIAPYVHLARGDEIDEPIDESHDAKPSGEVATLRTWMRHGPAPMRDRFLYVALMHIEDFNERRGDYLGAVSLAEQQLIQMYGGEKP